MPSQIRNIPNHQTAITDAPVDILDKISKVEAATLVIRNYGSNTVYLGAFGDYSTGFPLEAREVLAGIPFESGMMIMAQCAAGLTSTINVLVI